MRILMFLVIFAVALAFSSIGFKKYVWFISLGYGFAIAGIGLFFVLSFGLKMTVGTAVASILFIVYGCRLSGYLAIREIKSSAYNEKMKTEIKSGTDMKLVAKCAIWISAALLYACETSPFLFRIQKSAETDIILVAGIVISLCGLIIESLADYQKNAAKKLNPKRFVDTGLFRIVRCPNYFGEMLFWTGVFVGNVTMLGNVWEWLAALLGYLGIIYVMFGGARRLEMRQNRTYGDDEEYKEYVRKTPIMIPLIPLYSVEKYKWLVA